jgi:hypothetical protein
MLREMVVRSSASRSRTNGRLGGQNHGFIVACHVGGAPEVAIACMLSIRGWTATTTIGGHDAVEEYVACKIYPLAASFSFKSAPLGMTPMLKVETPQPLFAVGTIATEYADHFLVEVETEAKRVLESFGLREYNALIMVNISNGDRLNRVFEQIGVPHFPHPQPDSIASQSANKKWKAKVAKKPAAKKAKAGSGRALRLEWCHLYLKRDQLRRSTS